MLFASTFLIIFLTNINYTFFQATTGHSSKDTFCQSLFPGGDLSSADQSYTQCITTAPGSCSWLALFHAYHSLPVLLIMIRREVVGTF